MWPCVTWPYSFVTQKKQHRKYKNHTVSAAIHDTRKMKKKNSGSKGKLYF